MDTDLRAPPGKLLVIQRAPEAKSEGGLDIPARAQTRVAAGVVAITEGGQLHSIGWEGLQMGDTVYWSGFAGENLKHEGTVYRVLAYEDILAWAPAQEGDNDDGD